MRLVRALLLLLLLGVLGGGGAFLVAFLGGPGGGGGRLLVGGGGGGGRRWTVPFPLTFDLGVVDRDEAEGGPRGGGGRVCVFLLEPPLGGGGWDMVVTVDIVWQESRTFQLFLFLLLPGPMQSRAGAGMYDCRKRL